MTGAEATIAAGIDGIINRIAELEKERDAALEQVAFLIDYLRAANAHAVELEAALNEAHNRAAGGAP